MSKDKKQPETVDIKTPFGDENLVEEIVLPPEEMWAELENSQDENKPVASAKTKPEPPAEVVKLDFIEPDKLIKTVKLHYPFKFNGEVCEEISMHRLTVGQMGELIDELPDKRHDNFDIYAKMCHLPAPVLRGLNSEDGMEVARIGMDFLPQMFE